MPELTAEQVMSKTTQMIEEVIIEMKQSGGLLGEDRLRNALWRFVNQHTKVLREFYKIGQ